jgi:AraC-type DNA-binding domain-containing proteins
VFRAVEHEPQARWAEIAIECGYYDQAHLIREFRAFAGMNPPAFFAQLSDFTEQFTRKRRAAQLHETA